MADKLRRREQLPLLSVVIVVVVSSADIRLAPGPLASVSDYGGAILP